jgi:hypothetical protein
LRLAFYRNHQSRLNFSRSSQITFNPPTYIYFKNNSINIFKQS